MYVIITSPPRVLPLGVGERFHPVFACLANGGPRLLRGEAVVTSRTIRLIRKREPCRRLGTADGLATYSHSNHRQVRSLVRRTSVLAFLRLALSSVRSLRAHTVTKERSYTSAGQAVPQ